MAEKGSPGSLFMVLLFVCIALAIAIFGGLRLDVTTSYSSAYAGVKPSFHGVYVGGFAYESPGFRGTQMDFDLDDPKRGLPDLEGEMTTIFLPEKINPWELPDWVPESRLIGLSGGEEPVNVYEWTIDDVAYRMEEYELKWFVGMEAGYDSVGIFDEEGNNQRWRNAEVWLKLDTSPSWIFEGADKTYFAVAKVQVDYVEVEGHDPSKIDVSPESHGTALSLFYLPYGEAIDLSEDTFIGYAVGETRLNPEVFRDQVFTMIRLDDFGTQAWYEGLTRKYMGDTAVWEFTVKVFVVGEWELKDVQDVSELVEEGYGRNAKIVTTGVQYRIPWGDLFNLQGKIVLFLIGIAVIMATLMIVYGMAQGFGAGVSANLRRGS